MSEGAIVVTGATGHLGNALARELVARGRRVRALVLPGEDTRPLAGVDVERVEGSILDVGGLARVFRGAEAVFHLAGIVAIVPGKARLLHQVNVAGTRNVVETCLRAGVGRLVYTASIHALAEPAHGVVDEASPFDPDRVVGDYGRSKARAALSVLDAVRRGLDAVIVCPTGVVGPHDYRPSEMGQLFLDFARRRLAAYVAGAYDFVDSRDVAAGQILALERGRAGQSYILSGERVTTAWLMRTLRDLTGARIPPRLPLWLVRAAAAFVPAYSRLTGVRPRFTPDTVRTLVGNSLISPAKAQRELGYAARPVRLAIADTVQWFRETGRL